VEKSRVELRQTRVEPQVLYGKRTVPGPRS
jgi:hypothetical protein